MENATGSAFNDLIFGDSANNTSKVVLAMTISMAEQAVTRCLLQAQHMPSQLSWSSRVCWPWLFLGGVAQDSFIGMENATGSAFNDLIFGDSANNTSKVVLAMTISMAEQAVTRCLLQAQHMPSQLSLELSGLWAMAIPGMVWPRTALSVWRMPRVRPLMTDLGRQCQQQSRRWTWQ